MDAPHSRSELGPADVDDATLVDMVRDLLGAPGAELLSSRVEPVAYDVPAITTAGRWWVCGEARVDGTARPWRIFVKHVQSWSRSEYFQHVPEEHRAWADASVPWRNEPLAYRSTLGDDLPAGLRMPRALGVHDLDDKASVLWLEPVDEAPATPWDLDRYATAAHLVGRMAASPLVARHRRLAWQEGDVVQSYLRGRAGIQVVPALRSEELWQHPLVAAHFGDLRSRLVEATAHLEAHAGELAAVPETSNHGDACPNNLLLPADGDGFVLIDYGWWSPGPVGFDLTQLLVGELQMGRSAAADLPAIEETVLPAYVEGLAAEGLDVPLAVVRRAHALLLLLFVGISSVPLEQLGEEPTEELHAQVAERAALTRFSLDLVDATA